MTELRAERHRFRVRAAGVAIRDERALVSRAVQPSHWTNFALLGGGVNPGEASADAVVREFREELGIDVRTGRLLWCVENFFRHDGREWHEIGFFWEVILPADFPHRGPEPFFGRDVEDGHPVGIECVWWPIERLGEIDLRPSFLVAGLRDPPATTRFLVPTQGGVTG